MDREADQTPTQTEKLILWSLILLLCVVTAGAVAFGVWEPASYAMMGGDAGGYAKGLVLLGTFVAVLVVLRLFTDRFIPMNLTLPRAADLVLGGAFGAWKLGVWKLLSTRSGKAGDLRGPRAGERVLRYGSLWKSLVAAAWLLAAGMPVAAAWIGGIAVAIFVLVALVREAGPQLAEPAGWRS